jgi:hypothetical protein
MTPEREKQAWNWIIVVASTAVWAIIIWSAR